MVSFKPFIFLCSGAIALALPSNTIFDARGANANLLTLNSSSNGTSGGYYYYLWEQVNSGVTMNIGSGQYHLTWNSASQDVIAGIGWMPGSAQ